MNSLTSTTEKNCSRATLAAYIEGELSPREELEIETHLARCKSCAAELNEQKKILCVLDFALESEKVIELPANFTKVLIANAQSNVSGLRSPRERLKAFSVCLVLLLIVFLGLNRETSTIFNGFIKFTDQFLAISNFVVRLIYDVSIGIAVILRSFGNHLVSSSFIAPVFLIALFLVSLLAISRLFFNYKRA